MKKIDSQYDLVLLAKERTSQLNAGDPPLVSNDNDKNTVISLREIGEGKISIKTLEDSAINKLRIQQRDTSELEELEDGKGDNFEKIYKGEISKSGTSILPSKRIRRIPEKSNFVPLKSEHKNDNKELKQQEEETKSLPADNKSQK